eukprot:3223439-Rhodomonas_salina.7
MHVGLEASIKRDDDATAQQMLSMLVSCRASSNDVRSRHWHACGCWSKHQGCCTPQSLISSRPTLSQHPLRRRRAPQRNTTLQPTSCPPSQLPSRLCRTLPFPTSSCPTLSRQPSQRHRAPHPSPPSAPSCPARTCHTPHSPSFPLNFVAPDAIAPHNAPSPLNTAVPHNPHIAARTLRAPLSTSSRPTPAQHPAERCRAPHRLDIINPHVPDVV